ncbi:manganese efflux pump [Luteolibacter yonseiensis]
MEHAHTTLHPCQQPRTPCRGRSHHRLTMAMASGLGASSLCITFLNLSVSLIFACVAFAICSLILVWLGMLCGESVPPNG